MYKGTDIIGVAQRHIGEEYILGAVALLANSGHRGPWDCAEFVSWCAYQAYGIVYAVRPPDPRRGESYSGWWFEDAAAVGRSVTVSQALATAGAVLVRKPRSSGSPRIGHVAISLGNRSTVEAKDRATGVAEVAGAEDRLWDVGVLLPGVEYSAGGTDTYRPPQGGLRLADPFQRGPAVAALQRALAAAGLDPGGRDGVFGPLTHAAVVNFQIRQGLVPDGYVGPETARALGLGYPIEPTADDIVATGSAMALSTVGVRPQPAAEDEVEARPAHADPQLAARTGPATFSFETVSRKIFAVPSSGERFYVGYSVPYTDDMARRGLAQKQADLGSAAKFDRVAEAEQLGKWAHFLWPTIVAESAGYFGRINSYDRAAFTFGCYQFAAHTPGDNLVLLFRRLLQLPDAGYYFPDLALKQRSDGATTVHRIDGAGSAVDLEVARMVTRPNGVREKQIPDFMQYLNSDPTAVDPAEQNAAARLMLWCEESDAARVEQIRLAIDTAKRKLRETRDKVPEFDGRDWRIALWVNDIRHQGRAKYSAIGEALRSTNPVAALSRLGAAVYNSRKETVKELVGQLEAEGTLNGWQPNFD